MKRSTLIAIIMTSFYNQSYAAEAPKTGWCYSRDPMATEESRQFACDHIGQIKNVGEVSQKGFRVISSGFIPPRSNGDHNRGFYLIIEERK